MIVIFSLLLTLSLLLIIRSFEKDIKSPAFILSAVWVLIYFVVYLYWGNNEIINNRLYLIFFVSVFVFVFGFLLTGNKRGLSGIQKGPRKIKVKFSKLFLQLSALILLLITIYNAYDMLKFIYEKNVGENLWHGLGVAEETYIAPLIIKYSKPPILILSYLLGLAYFCQKDKENRNFFLFFTFLAFLNSILGGNRGGIFHLIISLLFIYLIVNNYNNRILWKVFIRVGFILLGIFVISSFAKFVYQDQSNTVNFINYHLRSYFSLSPIAFVEWYKLNVPFENGANTFRFFFAIAEVFGGPEVNGTVKEYIVFEGTWTNVYTILQYYTADFGLFYALIIIALIGVIYGYLYKKAVYSSKFNPMHIVLLGMLYTPLLYHFFADLYFSQTSFWFQNVFWLFLFTRGEFMSYKIKEN